MAKLRNTLDLSKFRDGLTKGIDGISTGFRDPKVWVDTGNYSLNYLISGDFNKGVPLGKVTIIAGQSGSGKSYIASANLIRNAQAKGIIPVLIDTENALDEDWLQKLGVDTSDDKLIKVNLAMINQASAFISNFVKGYRDEYSKMAEKDRPGVLFVIDSLGMMLTPNDIDQFDKGDLKGNMGIKPKALKALILNCVNMFADLNIGLVATNHTMQSQDMFNPDDVIVGGSGQIFAASIVVAMRKGKLKEDEDGNKTSDVNGMRAMITVVKSRFNHKSLYKKVEIKIPFESGMNPYSGIFEMMESEGLLVKEGNRYAFKDSTGAELYKAFRKNFTNEMFDKIMEEYPKLMEQRAASDAAEASIKKR
jgi:recombination protein RecA